MKNLFLLLTITTSAFTQIVSDYAYTGANAMAIAGAAVANPGSYSSPFSNPGSLNDLDGNSVFLGQSNILSVPYKYLGATFSTDQFGMVAVSLQQSKVKSGSAELSKETDIGISSAFYLRNDKNSTLSVGYTFHSYQWSLGESAGPSGDGSDGLPGSSGYAFGLDLGIIASLRDKHRLGAWIRNVNSPTIGEGNSTWYLPRRMALGIAYMPYKGLTTSLTFDRQIGEDIQVKGGIDYRLTELFTIRFGVQSNPNRMGAGFGLHHKQFRLDYGLITHPVLPIIQQIAMAYQF